MSKVSVVIPTYNRFKYVLRSIKSIKNQTYNNIEIIVINDCSDEKEYYNYDWEEEGVIMLHLPENSKKIFGYACAGFVRNKGIEISNGTYIAFCDDDDIWFPTKIELQLKAIKETGCKMSSTDALIGYGMYNPNKEYPKYNSEWAYNYIINQYSQQNSILMNNGFPNIFNKEFIEINNCIINSSVLIEKSILDTIGNFKNVKNDVEDYDCWLRALEHTDCIYLSEPCIYYDLGHGYGSNHKN